MSNLSSHMAQALVDAAGGLEQSQYLSFALGEETFAIGILGIKEIIEYDKLTPVPDMPACVRGVINLRGAVVPVIDLAARFGRGQSDTTRRTCIVIVEVKAGAAGVQTIGLLVDAVNEVMDLQPQDIEPAPALGAGTQARLISGMGKVGDKLIMILNTAQLLDVRELGQLADDEARAQA